MKAAEAFDYGLIEYLRLTPEAKLQRTDVVGVDNVVVNVIVVVASLSTKLSSLSSLWSLLLLLSYIVSVCIGITVVVVVVEAVIIAVIDVEVVSLSVLCHPRHCRRRCCPLCQCFLNWLNRELLLSNPSCQAKYFLL